MFSTFKNILFKQNILISNIKRSIALFNNPLFFKATPSLFAEPLKKKKRIDPAIIRAREERRRKKIEKEIRKLEKIAKHLKPCEEIDPPFDLVSSAKERHRESIEISDKVKEERILLEKQWATYKHKQNIEVIKNIDKLLYSQQKALDELRMESEDLYQEAIQIDTTLVPYFTKGPTYTPPIKNYQSPDGEYRDISKKWK